jgi:hypothetical protein
MQLAGLISNILGAFFLFIGTEQLNGILFKIIEHLRLHSTGFERQEIPENMINRLEIKKTLSTLFTYLGLMFFIAGFALQIIALR